MLALASIVLELELELNWVEWSGGCSIIPLDDKPLQIILPTIYNPTNIHPYISLARFLFLFLLSVFYFRFVYEIMQLGIRLSVVRSMLVPCHSTQNVRKVTNKPASQPSIEPSNHPSEQPADAILSIRSNGPMSLATSAYLESENLQPNTADYIRADFRNKWLIR